jgi:hypothetical protein
LEIDVVPIGGGGRRNELPLGGRPNGLISRKRFGSIPDARGDVTLNVPNAHRPV